MSLLKRIERTPKKAILEQVLERLHGEGVLQSHIEAVLGDDTLSEQEQRLLQNNPVDFLLRRYRYRQPTLARQNKRHLMQRFLAELDPPTMGFTADGLEASRALLTTVVEDEGLTLSAEEFDDLWNFIVSEITGFGPLEPLLADATISKIFVLGYRNVTVMRNGERERLHHVSFEDDSHLARIIDRIFRPTTRDIDSPVLSTQLTDDTIAICVFPNQEFIAPVLVVHKITSRAPAG